jgi:hypothetical protein
MATKSELIAEVAALKARLEIAATVHQNQKNTIAGLEAKLATRGHIANTGVGLGAGDKPLRIKSNEPKVTLWTNRFGQLCETTRVGNTARTKVLSNQEQTA